jgi:hypothetical protein
MGKVGFWISYKVEEWAYMRVLTAVTVSVTVTSAAVSVTVTVYIGRV